MLQQRALEKNKQVFVDYLPVYHPAVKHLKPLNLDLASILGISMCRNAWGVWREEGALWDLICHDLAVLRYLWPNAKIGLLSVSGQKLNASHTHNDQATVQLVLDNVPVQMQVSCMSLQKMQRLEVVGQHTGWLLDYQSENVLQQVELKHSPMQMKAYPVQLPSKEPLRCAVESFVGALQNQTKMVTSIAFAIEVENIIRDIHQEALGVGG